MHVQAARKKVVAKFIQDISSRFGPAIREFSSIISRTIAADISMSDYRCFNAVDEL